MKTTAFIIISTKVLDIYHSSVLTELSQYKSNVIVIVVVVVVVVVVVIIVSCYLSLS